jgi:hypothetical protein
MWTCGSNIVNQGFHFRGFSNKLQETQGIHAQLGTATHKRNTVWKLQYEGSMSEAWAHILNQQWHAIVACNILTYKLIVCGSFNQLTVAWGWPYKAKTCHNSKIKCDFNHILRNVNVIVMTS